MPLKSKCLGSFGENLPGKSPIVCHSRLLRRYAPRNDRGEKIASSLRSSQRQREEELSPVEKTAIIGLLALVSVALAVWATRLRGSTGGSDSIKLQAVLKLH